MTDARSFVAVMLTFTICVAILAPIAARILERRQGVTTPALSDTVVQSLTDLLKVVVGAVVGWLAAS